MNSDNSELNKFEKLILKIRKKNLLPSREKFLVDLVFQIQDHKSIMSEICDIDTKIQVLNGIYKFLSTIEDSVSTTDGNIMIPPAKFYMAPMRHRKAKKY